ncbi:MlaD family protein [Svornostia abyssi]|uniref:MlaD family protein n=1 Tax=Svornostia abyssi TaxID=2898438 RepID=A0ABY5PIQ8_9ACTN|nr:MlaD family protein [Parviterribacteraceae bacterium J379]
MSALTRRRVVGALIVVLTPIAVAVATVRPTPGGSADQTVYVVFDDIRGLAKVNRDVRIAGVDVGTIGTVTRVGDDAEAELVLTAEAGEIYRDATAELRPHAAFEGDAWVDLEPGTPGAGPLQDGRIPKEQTSVYEPLDRAVRFLDPPRRDAIAAGTGELAKAQGPRVERAVGDTLEELPELVRAVPPAARAAQGPGGDELRSSIRDLSSAATVLGERSQTVAGIVTDTRRTLAAANTDDRAPLDDSLEAIPGTIAELRRGSDAVPALMARVRRTSRELDPALPELTALLREGRPVLAQATPVLRDAPPLARDVQLILDDLARSTPAMRAMVRSVLEAVVTIESDALPVLLRDSTLGRPTYEQFLSAAAGLTAALANFQPGGSQYIGKGHWARVGGDLRSVIASVTSNGPGAAERCRARVRRTTPSGEVCG